MKKMSILDRILLLLTGLLAAYQIVVGIDQAVTLAVGAYTIAFGVLLIAGLLLIIMGFEVLDSPLVVIVSTIIPLSLSLGLVSDYLPGFTTLYLVFVVVGFLAVVVTRYTNAGKIATMVLATVHGIAGLLIFLLPIILALRGEMAGGFALVGVGGALIGVGGLLLAFLKAGKPILPQKTILTVLPGLLLLMTGAFVAGFSLA
ncbi:MAG: hypothetical protein KBG20_18020 [Caldilineaceae bacterium]|nr:hypothetical protein [Caldilineaceae bacterium]MBP8108200.1 hypothetical protein [Caldilineaceae bacterium]MBP8124236.1 hypothetical protein [Caldilineaceae bacterium]MBP9074208.1 hypothetical protein [Caldilineaceae bacterium]